MIYFLALIPATVLTIAGYFVLFLSARSEGALRTFGKYLGFWAFTLAGLVILGAIFAAAHGRHRGPILGIHGMHERLYGPWPGREEPRGIGPPGNTPRGATPQPPAEPPSPAGPPIPAPPAPR
jgi:hypothetical protein